VTDGQQSIDTTIAEIEKLRKILKQEPSKQVQAADEKQIIKATALAWFNNHRGTITKFVTVDAINGLDKSYQELLAGAGRSTVRTKYLDIIKDIRKLLVGLQTDQVLALAKAPVAVAPKSWD
jgi:hypothetical protein